MRTGTVCSLTMGTPAPARRLTVNRVHVGYQQDRNRSLGIQLAGLIGNGVTPAFQLGF